MRGLTHAFMVAFLLLPVTALAEDTQTKEDVLSLTDASLTLNQSFERLPQWRQGGVQVNAAPAPLSDPSFSWVAGYIWDHPPVGAPRPWPQPTRNFPAWTSNGAAEASPNGDMIARLPPNLAPLTWSKTLDFNVRPMPADLANTVSTSDPKDYLGATISSFPYAQKYGVFEMSAKLPTGKGIWPAFWLLPVDKSWPPEIDVMEVLGKEPRTVYTTVHTNFPKRGASFGQGTDTHVDLSADFHTYTVDWGPARINWYFDHKLIFTQPTPPDLQKPCYIIANVAVGSPKSWGGAPDATTNFPATMHVSYIKAWQREAYQD